MQAAAPVIRHAVLADAVGIFELIRSQPAALIPRSLNDIVENVDRFVVAVRGRQVVGCASWHMLPEVGAPDRATVEIRSVAVRSGLRGTGLGTALVRAVLKRIRPLGASQALVLTFAPDFFSRLGFREVPKTQVMHKIYTGCVNCTKHADPFNCPEIAMVLGLPR
jgi:amino-acid N-acetyltransferase